MAEKKQKPKGEEDKVKVRVLFVCLGNICRSPAAEGVLRAMARDRRLDDRLEVDSAGTYGGHAGQLPDPRMREAALRRGYMLTHRARQVRREDFSQFDRIVAMDASNYRNLCRLAPSSQAAARVVRMADFFRRFSGQQEVPDPYYEGREGFERVLDLLEDACQGLLEEITAENA